MVTGLINEVIIRFTIEFTNGDTKGHFQCAKQHSSVKTVTTHNQANWLIRIKSIPSFSLTSFF